MRRDARGDVRPPSCARHPAAERRRFGPLAGKVARDGEGPWSQIGTRFGKKHVLVLPFPHPCDAGGSFPSWYCGGRGSEHRLEAVGSFKAEL